MLPLPRLIGHRGAAAHAPENTLAGFRVAAAQGVPWVEFDVMLAAEGIPALLHDETLQRTAGDPRTLAAVSWSELVRLDAGAWFGPAFAGERIPSLVEAIACLQALGLGANLEIKPAAGTARETAAAVAAVLAAHWPAELPLLLSSFEVESLEVARDLAPAVPRGYLVEELPADWAATAARLGCVTVHPWHEPLTEAQVAAVKAAGYGVAAYTVNHPGRAALLRRWGVDSLITDDPPALAGVE